MKLAIKLLLAAALCTGLYFFCEKQTQGFRTHLILSNLPNDPRWDFPAATDKEKALLDQPFTFLGSGGWCYAFLGQDGKTVLKFFKHDHLLALEILRDFSFPKLIFKSPPFPAGKYYFQELNFNSCRVLFDALKEKTGLLYLHLNKGQENLKPVVLYDKIGVRHLIDLNQTEFVVQQKAELCLPYLEKLHKQGQTEEIKTCIDSMLDCLLSLSKQGIRDLDLSFEKNFGFIDGQAVIVDLSSFVKDDEMKISGNYKKEILSKTTKLRRWLKNNDIALLKYYEQKTNEILDQQPL